MTTRYEQTERKQCLETFDFDTGKPQEDVQSPNFSNFIYTDKIKPRRPK